MGWSHTHVWWLRSGRYVLAVEVLLEERGVPGPHQFPQDGPPLSGRGVLTISGCENHQEFYLGEKEVCWKPRHPLKRPMNRLNRWWMHLLWALVLGSTLKSTTDIWGGNDQSGCRVRAGGATFSIILFLCWAIIQPSLQMQVNAKSEYPLNLPHPGDCLRTHSSQLTHRPDSGWY